MEFDIEDFYDEIIFLGTVEMKDFSRMAELFFSLFFVVKKRKEKSCATIDTKRMINWHVFHGFHSLVTQSNNMHANALSILLYQ